MPFQIKRGYEKRSLADGYRVLVDGMWLRGLTKEKAHINLWLKDIAPSTELRKWYSHDPNKWYEFKKRYIAEIKSNKNMVHQLLDLYKEHKHITLVYGSKSPQNNAVVLADYLNKKLK